MAADIVPIELCLTAGDLVTLWAPPWRMDGEEWEAFLGDEDNVFAFTDVAELVGFIRTAAEHDLVDHPSWPMVAKLPAPDLRPEDSHRYDLVGVPELVAQEPDTWAVDELADTVSLLRSLADVCDLNVVRETLAATPVFDMLEAGRWVFHGRDGARRWDELCMVIAQRWEDVLDTLDELVRAPEVDPAVVAAAASELAAAEADEITANAVAEGEDAADTDDTDNTEEDAGNERGAMLAFWSGVGIDPIRITSGLGEHYTLRCYVDDEPVFLGSDGRIDVFGSPEALGRYLAAAAADADDSDSGHDLATVATWDRVLERVRLGELDILVDDGNSYILTGVAEGLATGPDNVDPEQLELAVELITDADRWAGSDVARDTLASSEPLGWLVSFILRPDPTRMAPSPPYDTEVQGWQALVSALENRLRPH